MSKYEVFKNIDDATSITKNMFGVNFVTSYDHEFSMDADDLSLLKELGATTLRFPGGSVTERDFTEASFMTGDWAADQYINPDGNINKITPISDFLSVAGQIGADVQLVIPTRVAFTQSAGQSMASGNYGNRQDISLKYLSALHSFLEYSFSEADKYGVTITKFELGNEFWGSGEMTASEYGYLAANLSVMLKEDFPNVKILAQVASSANFFSPLSSQDIYLEPDGEGDFIIHTKEEFNNTLPASWLEGQMPGSGNAITQSKTIADQFLQVPGAKQALAGIIDHVYFDAGFAGVDTQRDFALKNVPAQFALRLGLNDIEHHVTEWSPRNPRGSNPESNLGNANGLQYAHSVVEAFFELASNGVDSANFWPTTFGDPSLLHRVLIDTTNDEYTFGGIAFQWLSQGTIGLYPYIDFELEKDFDLHGFKSETRISLFASDRSGYTEAKDLKTPLEISLLDLDKESYSFVRVSYLNSSDASFDNTTASPIVNYSNGYMSKGNEWTFEFHTWDLAWIDIQVVSYGNDTIRGGGGNDAINGEGGNDLLFGFGGSDSLKGQLGDDVLLGGEGYDRLFGGWGIDSLYGGDGADYLDGGHDNDLCYGGRGSDIMWGREGNDLIYGGNQFDTIYGGEGNDTVDGGNGRDLLYLNQGNDIFLDNGQGGYLGQDTVFAGYGDDTIQGGGGNDVFHGEWGNDLIYGGIGNDVLYGGDQFDTIYGGDGNDTIDGGNGRDAVFMNQGNDLYIDNTQSGTLGQDTVFAGYGDDTIQGGGGNDAFYGEWGNDLIYGGDQFDFVDGGDGNDTIYGGDGRDTVLLGAGNDVYVDTAQTGDLGQDTITGGAGADRFEFQAAMSADVITDFQVGIDDLQLTQSLWGSGLISAQVVSTYASVTAEGVLFDFGAGQSILLQALISTAGLENDILLV